MACASRRGMSRNTNPLLTADEVAKRLNVSTDWVWDSEGTSAEAWRFREEMKTTDMAWLHGSLKSAANLLPNVWRGVRYVVEMFGGPGRDRTDDLFHAISATSRNSLKRNGTNRAVTLLNTGQFAVIGLILDLHQVQIFIANRL